MRGGPRGILPTGSSQITQGRRVQLLYPLLAGSDLLALDIPSTWRGGLLFESSRLTLLIFPTLYLSNYV